MTESDDVNVLPEDSRQRKLVMDIARDRMCMT